MKFSLTHALKLLLFLLIVAGCKKIVTYPDEPSISFTSAYSRDTTDDLGNPIKQVVLTFHLIDGNGDMGLDPADNTGPFSIDSAFYYNFIIQEYKKVNNDFVEVPAPAGLKQYRIPDLTPTGQNKTLIADVSVTIEYPYSSAIPLPYKDFRYEFYVIDRSFNFSNRDTSSVISW